VDLQDHLGVFPSNANRTTVLSVPAGGRQIIVDRIVACSTGASTPNVTVTLLKSGVTPANPGQDIVSAAACSANVDLQVWPPLATYVAAQVRGWLWMLGTFFSSCAAP